MSNVYLSIHDISLIKDLIAFEQEQNEIQIVGISTDVHENIDQWIQMEVDVLVFQFTSDVTLCASLLAKIIESTQLQDMQLLIMFKELDTEIIHMLMQYDIHDFLMEPYSSEQLIHAICQRGKNKEIHDVAHWNMETMATQTMRDLGLPLHLNGFQYIRTCALLVAQSYTARKMVIGNVYLECAKFYETTSSRVEKSIRTAINFAFRTQPENICIYNDKPTNSQIILYISEKLKLFSVG